MTWQMLWPFLTVVAANTVYNICAKSTPESVNAFASLTATYGVAAVCAFVLFLITGTQKNLIAELGKTNWSSYVLGIAVVGLELGFLYLYRSGWKISIGQICTSISVTCVLLIVGLLFYKEILSLRQIFGIFIAVVGLFLITK